MMSASAIFWVVVYVIAALLFFATASVITVIGIRDLRDLLSRSVKTKDDGSTIRNA